MPVGIARSFGIGLPASRVGYSCGLALFLVLFGCRGLQTAVADGDTRSISLHHIHTNEDISITYKRNGRYDEAALEKLNWLLRDWRRGKEIRMDPQLIDLLWEVQRETGSKQPIYVVCGYRSPETNAMLRRRSRGVARFSQHTLGHAVDFYIPGVPLAELRVIGLRMQRGGVGFYPTSGSPFVHMDTGGVRMWPRMTRDQLLHVFPDGRTVYLPSDGHPLPGYALALVDLKKRGQNPTETWFDEARAQRPDKTTVLASNDSRAERAGAYYDMAQADQEEDAREAAAAPAQTPATATAPPVAPTSSANPLREALEREAARRRAAASLPAPALPRESAALYQTASYTAPVTDAPPLQSAALSANQIIAARGDWRSPADESSAEQTGPSGTAARRTMIASVADATGSITPSADLLGDRLPSAFARSYAPQTDEVSLAGTAAPNVHPVLAQAAAQQPPAAGALKQGADQAVSTIAVGRPPHDPAAGKDARFDDPWLDAILLAPSVRHYLTTLTLGAPDYSKLAPLVQKPAHSVRMTFGNDPNPGMTYDHFSGSAVVFIATAT